MRRKSTFEDFEKLMDDTEPASESMEEASEAKARRHAGNPKIPANGSELFEESEAYTKNETYTKREKHIKHEKHTTHETDAKRVDEAKHEVDAEERYRRREEKLRAKAAARRKSHHTGGKLLALLQLIVSVVFMGLIFRLDVLPMKYFIGASIVFLILALICFLLQFRRHGHWTGKIISIIVIVVLVIGSVFVARTMQTLNRVTQTKNYQTDKIVIAVLADDPAESLSDAKDYKFGIVSTIDRSKVDLAITQMNNNLKSEIDVTELSSYSEILEALYSGEIDAMIYNQAMDDTIEENNPGFQEKIRIIDNFNVETEIYMEDVPDLPITKEPFIVFLSGMDSYDDLEDETNRSDVNIIACVNPTTKQILLVSVPRDAYVDIPGITDGEKDKLTHAGMYGIQYSMAAIENIFDIDISYYVRVNFSALIMMVDALGGIDVESDYSFSTYYKQYNQALDKWMYYEYDKGMNHLDGIYALAFARERMNAAGGDYQRAKNQQKVIAALLEKIKSPAVLTGYTSLLASLEGKMETNLSSQQLASLVKMQLNDSAEWNIISSSVYGVSSQEYCASYAGSALDVEILDDDSIDAVKEVIEQLMKGEIISEPRTTALQEAYEVDESDMDDDYYVNNHADDYEYDDYYWENGGYLDDDDYETFSKSEDE